MSVGNLLEISGIIVATVPFVIMSLCSSKINLQREIRGHQFVMPLIAIIYCIPMMLLVNQIAEFIIHLVSFLMSISGFIPFIGGAIQRLFGSLYSVLHVGYVIQLFCNAVIMTAFCGVKRVALPLIKKWWIKWRRLYEMTTAHFYVEVDSRCILLKRFTHMRMFFKILYYTAIVLGALDCILVFIFRESEVFAFPFYPVFGIIVLGEIAFFFDGYYYGERKQEEEEDEPKIVDVDYTALREELKRKFGDRICLDDDLPGVQVRKEPSYQQEEDSDADELDRVAEEYFHALQDGSDEIQADYVLAAKKLLHRKSVLFYNPFYRDVTDYILLPMFHEMLNHNRCLIVCGRLTNEDDIVQWIREGIEHVTNLPKLWKIGKLSAYSDSVMPDIGILGFRNLYDIDNLRTNKNFFAETTFIIMLEPSNLLGTGQIGIRSVIQLCEQKNKPITYCIFDRNADGLVDALSHLVRQSITEVIASPAPTAAYSRVLWKADGPGMQTRILPRISHYLGIGTEIASLAMHQGVDDIHWYSGSKMPLLDLKWNAEQYYQAICQYIHSPREQSEMSSRFHFHENLWQADFKEKPFLIIEDEFNNVFEMERTFAARIRKKGFVNVLSENYMLRDYMCQNPELFSNDLKAIPSIVPDYAITRRNFVLRTLILMAASPVDESVLNRELALHGCDTRNTYQKLCELIETHLGLKDFHIQTLREYVEIGGNKYSRFSYKVEKSLVETVFDSALRSAFYVVENEKLNVHPMGNKLMGHMEQLLLPGQFFCYEGKYYQVRSISPQNGIVVRRSAEHLTGRIYYRQLRDYNITVISESEDAQNLRGMKIQNICGDIVVETDGYLELKSRDLIREASLVSLDAVRQRNIAHKEILKVSIPEASPEIRYTICVLLNEIFQTLYPNEHAYIIAAPGELPSGVENHKDYKTMIRALVPSLSSDRNCSDSIYFIEDSCIDLGLLVSIERNLKRIFEILYDYLEWYLSDQNKKEHEENEKTDSDDENQNNAFHNISFNKEAESDVEGEDEELIDDSDIDTDKLQDRPFLNYGHQNTPEWLNLKETLIFLKEHQFNDSNIHKSRKKTPEFDEGSNYDPSQPGTHYCDFCGRPLEKGKYDILKDGRERCPECGKDAIKTRKQFKAVYSETLKEMERIFGITIDCPIKVRMVNANKVNDIPGEKFTPTPRMDGRVLGYAQSSKDGYKILVENGAPKWKMKSTLVHELTHIWQYRNWSEEDVRKICRDEVSRGLIVEGMAVWGEVQYLLSMGEEERAIMYKRSREMDMSVYGVGMKKFLKKYPAKKISSMTDKKTPFKKFPPI